MVHAQAHMAESRPNQSGTARRCLAATLGAAAFCLIGPAGVRAQSSHPAVCQAAPPASTAPENGSILEKVVASLGDPGVLASLRGIRFTTKTTLGTGPNILRAETTVTRIYPDRLVLTRKYEIPGGRESLVEVSPDGAYSQVSGGPKTELPPGKRDELLNMVRLDRFYIGQSIGNGKVKVIETRKEMLGGNEVAVLRLDSGGAQVTWYVSPTDGRLLRSVTQVASPAGMVDAVVDYSDWISATAWRFPFCVP